MLQKFAYQASQKFAYPTSEKKFAIPNSLQNQHLECLQTHHLKILHTQHLCHKLSPLEDLLSCNHDSPDLRNLKLSFSIWTPELQ